MAIRRMIQSSRRHRARLLRGHAAAALEKAGRIMPTTRRSGDTPKVQVNDPLEPHMKLLTAYTDKDIHDVTAYLVTLK